MQAAEYFDSIAQFWDMEYSDNELAREITAAISVPRGGGYVLEYEAARWRRTQKLRLLREVRFTKEAEEC